MSGPPIDLTSTAVRDLVTQADAPDTASLKCRFCAAPLRHTFVDLGCRRCARAMCPRSVDAMEPFYPLHARLRACLLCSSRSTCAGGDLQRVRVLLVLLRFLGRARPRLRRDMIEPLRPRAESLVVEVASNDGYLLQHFVARASRCSGSSPPANVAEAAVRAEAIPTS